MTFLYFSLRTSFAKFSPHLVFSVFVNLDGLLRLSKGATIFGVLVVVLVLVVVVTVVVVVVVVVVGVVVVDVMDWITLVEQTHFKIFHEVLCLIFRPPLYTKNNSKKKYLFVPSPKDFGQADTGELRMIPIVSLDRWCNTTNPKLFHLGCGNSCGLSKQGDILVYAGTCHPISGKLCPKQ